MEIIVHGWAFSPYVRAVRIALAEKSLVYRHEETTPAAMQMALGRDLTPFGQVPVFQHGGLRLLETPAILQYIDEKWPEPPLEPPTSAGRATMTMAMLLAANHFYPSGVMGVFFQEIYIPRNGGAARQDVVAEALHRARLFLKFLSDHIERDYLLGDALTLADITIAPMVHNFGLSPSGTATLRDYPKLVQWHARKVARPSWTQTLADVPLFGLPA